MADYEEREEAAIPSTTSASDAAQSKRARRRRSRTLAGEFRFLLTFTALVPLLIIGAWSLLTSLNDARAEAIADQSLAAIEAATLFDNFFSAAEQRLDTATVGVPWFEYDQEAQTSLLAILMSRSQQFEGISVVDHNGQELARVSRTVASRLLPLRDLSTRAEFTVPETTGAEFVGDVYIEEATGAPLLDISWPISDPITGEFSGVLFAHVQLAGASSSIRELSDIYGATSYMLDDSNRVIAHENPSVVLRSTFLEGSAIDGYRDGLDSEPVVMGTASIDVGGSTFSVVSETPTSIALEQWRAVLVRWLVLFAATIVVAMIVPLFITPRLTRPISDLVYAARSLAQGNLLARVHTTRKDEIGELASSFNEMAVRLETSITQLETEQEALRESNKELERFAAIAAHDLQEPIRKVQAFGSRLSRIRDDLDQVNQNYLDRILDSANRLEELTKALFEYTKIFRSEVDTRTFNPADVIHAVIANSETDIKEAGLEISVGELPSMTGSVELVGTVFTELIENAVKFHSPDRPPTLEITGRLHTSVKGERVEFVFADNGRGFPSRYRERIFEPFERLHARGTFEGTGMGLAIATRIVQRMGGSMTADGEPDEGATFTIDLPRKVT